MVDRWRVKNECLGFDEKEKNGGWEWSKFCVSLVVLSFFLKKKAWMLTGCCREWWMKIGGVNGNENGISASSVYSLWRKKSAFKLNWNAHGGNSKWWWGLPLPSSLFNETTKYFNSFRKIKMMISFFKIEMVQVLKRIIKMVQNSQLLMILSWINCNILT